MIEAHTLSAALAELIGRQTGLPAFDRRIHTTLYPSVFVQMRETHTEAIAGGRQILRRLEVRLTCLPDRERGEDGVRQIMHSLYGLLLPWFPACGRRFAPTAIATEGAELNELVFSLEFCDLPPSDPKPNTANMDSLQFCLDSASHEQQGE